MEGLFAIVDKKAQGKKNRAAGAKFEKKVRDHFSAEDYIVDKFGNNIDLESEELIVAKNFYIPGRGYTLGAGFPDFVMMRVIEFTANGPLYEVMFVECKINGLLTKEEKEKMRVLQNKGNICKIAYEDETQPNGFRLREFKYTEGRESIPRGD